MVRVFFNKRGTGKTKNLINFANEKVSEDKGDIVFIDDNRRHILELERRIRFISTNEFSIMDSNSFYGFLCGIISEDYDIDSIYIDELYDIVQVDSENAAHLFSKLEKLSENYNVDFYINICDEAGCLPEYIKKYVA